MAWISRGWKEYEVLDATQGLRLESWAGKLLVRPDPQVIWATERKDPPVSYTHLTLPTNSRV